MKSLIFIVAYSAEHHIESVFARIPYDRLTPSSELLLIDDASPDKTFSAAQQAAAKSPIRCTLLKNPVNLGYGGNQKLGYEYAIREGFESVVLIHGDGQYAPELIPEMLGPITDGEGADVVLGSRMMHKHDAIKGGMPLYKWIGNQVLTWLENRILGTNLSEFHTGLRAYRVSLLGELPFGLNSNDFHFDTDILIQCHRRGARFHEIPIPTRYGDEVCHVDGWKYFFDCLRSCMRDWMTQKGIFYCRRFDVGPAATLNPSSLAVQGSPQRKVFEIIPKNSTVLDLGGGNGWLADELASEKGCKVTIVDASFRKEPRLRHPTVTMDLNRDAPTGLGLFDTVLVLDILEHFPRARQTRLLDALREEQTGETRFIISAPNTAFFPLRLVFLFFGHLNYGRRGILDDTHAFLFTRKTFTELLADCGFRIRCWHFTPPPFELALRQGYFTRILTRLHTMLACMWPSMFAYQMIAECEALPTVKNLLARSIENRSPRS
jgi:glycosyltransferase involved in cell wall biosynthesis